MLTSKRTLVAVLALVSCLLAGGAGLFAYHPWATPPTQPSVARPAGPPSEQATAAEVFGTFEKRVRDAKPLFIAYVAK